MGRMQCQIATTTKMLNCRPLGAFPFAPVPVLTIPVARLHFFDINKRFYSILNVFLINCYYEGGDLNEKKVLRF